MVGHSFIRVHMCYKQEAVIDCASLKRQKELVSFPFLFGFRSHVLYVKNLTVGPTLISEEIGLVPSQKRTFILSGLNFRY